MLMFGETLVMEQAGFLLLIVLIFFVLVVVVLEVVLTVEAEVPVDIEYHIIMRPLEVRPLQKVL